MEWSLVLASQGIEHVIEHDESKGWMLSVSEQNHEKALGQIQQYRLETVSYTHLDVYKRQILTYDPYPNAGMNDVVRREILGRELVLTAKLKLENRAVDIHPGIALEYQGHEFTVKESVEHLQDDIVEVIGSHFLSLIEPVEAIAKLREILAASNPKL